MLFWEKYLFRAVFSIVKKQNETEITLAFFFIHRFIDIKPNGVFRSSVLIFCTSQATEFHPVFHVVRPITCPKYSSLIQDEMPF